MACIIKKKLKHVINVLQKMLNLIMLMKYKELKQNL
jgi:hypothetical protein